MGCLYGYGDLRWDRIRSRFPSRRRRVRTPRVVSAARPTPPRTASAAEPDPVSQRIDDLLGKISAEGKESLTEEEWEFLRSNSRKYRR